MSVLVVSAALVAIAGCSHFEEEPCYIGDKKRTRWYKNTATQVAYSTAGQKTADSVRFSGDPRTIADRTTDEVREITMAEVIRTALSNNKIVQSGTQVTVGNKAVLQNPDRIPSVFDPAIQETGVLFGGRGVEAALADFDTQASVGMTWGRNRTILNVRGTEPTAPRAPGTWFPMDPGDPGSPGRRPGSVLTQETGVFNSRLSKQLGYGGSLSLQHNWNYLGSDALGQLFPSAYTGSLNLAYRHPLMAGSGTEFTRIAGPLNPNFGAIAGVSQGVVIARINSDISVANFETAVRNQIRDIQKAYWDLYLAYRIYDTGVTAMQSTYQTWREAKIKLDVGTLKSADEAQALEQYYEAKAAVELGLNSLYKNEVNLRRLMGIPLSDGQILRPADQPFVAEFNPDWRVCLAESLVNRVELRRQKWSIKSLELQLKAARSLTKPRFDFVSSYGLNGFGDNLLQRDDDDGVSTPTLTTRGLNSAYETITQGDLPQWTAGFEFSMPIGFRSALAQVQNYEFRVAKARNVLAQQELEVAHDVTTSIQDLVATHTAALTNEARLAAARRRVEKLELERIEGTLTLDLVLRAQRARANAEQQYFTQITDYNKALIDLEFSKGTLLSSSGVFLAEGGWDPVAYKQAMQRAVARTNGFENNCLRTEPMEFVAAGPHQPLPLMSTPHQLETPIEDAENSDDEDAGTAVPPSPLDEDDMTPDATTPDPTAPDARPYDDVEQAPGELPEANPSLPTAGSGKRQDELSAAPARGLGPDIAPPAPGQNSAWQTSVRRTGLRDSRSDAVQTIPPFPTQQDRLFDGSTTSRQAEQPGKLPAIRPSGYRQPVSERPAPRTSHKPRELKPTHVPQQRDEESGLFDDLLKQPAWESHSPQPARSVRTRARDTRAAGATSATSSRWVPVRD